MKVYAQDVCDEWFLKSKINSGTDSCELDCASQSVDMGTFHCPDRCSNLCYTTVSPQNVRELALIVTQRSLTPAEQSLAAKYPTDAITVYLSKRTAEASVTRLFGDSFRNDESDAFRHFLWSALITKELGSSKAKAFLDAHESGSSQDPAELKMDSTNNQNGIETSTKLLKSGKISVEQLEREGLNKLRSHEFNVISPKGKVPSWKKENY